MTEQPPAGAAPYASGREADVFLLDDRRVLRRYRRQTDVSGEAAIMRYVAKFGFPVPVVHAVRGPEMVMERLDGPTMAQAVLAGQLSIPESATILAALLRQLHELPPRSAPDTRSEPHTGREPDTRAEPHARSEPHTGSAPGTRSEPDTRAEPHAGPEPDTRSEPNTRTEPPAHPSRDTIVHLDLHPDNVLMTSRGPVVIDWPNGGDGPGDLDTALTALMLGQAATGSIPHVLWSAAGELLDRFLAVAPGDPTRLLDDAVAIKAGQHTLSPEEVGRLGAAAARVLNPITQLSDK